MNLLTPYWKPPVPKFGLNVHVLESLVSSSLGPGSGQSFSLDWSEAFLSKLSEPPRVQRTSELKLRCWKTLLMCLKGPRVHLILLSSENGNSILTCFKNPIHHRESKRNGRRGGRWVKTSHINRPEAFQESYCFISTLLTLRFNQALELTCNNFYFSLFNFCLKASIPLF